MELTPELYNSIKKIYDDNVALLDKGASVIPFCDYLCDSLVRIKNINKEYQKLIQKLDDAHANYSYIEKDTKAKLTELRKGCSHELKDYYSDVYERLEECRICGKHT